MYPKTTATNSFRGLLNSRKSHPGHIGPLRVHFRSLHSGDEKALRLLFASLDADSLYRRFGGCGADLALHQIQVLLDDVIPAHAAMVATIVVRGHRRIVGLAHFCPGELDGYAEVAFLVQPAYRHLGIASGLLRRLVPQVPRQGFQGIVAQVQASNTSMLEVFRDVLGAPDARSIECGEILLRWTLKPAGPPRRARWHGAPPAGYRATEIVRRRRLGRGL